MAGEQAARLVAVEIERSLRRAVEQSFEGAGRQIKAFLAGMDVGAKGDMQKTNSLVAADMREAVVTAYENNVEAVRATPSYTRFNRRSGYLGRVIRRRDLATATPTRIQFIDEGALNKEAEHWRRLNFGAGQAAGPQPAPIPLRVFGETIDTLQLPYGPSAPFVLPKGFFVGASGGLEIPQSGRGGGAFYPNRKSPYTSRVTKGIRGRHFLEAGLEVMGVQLGVRYADLLNEWVQRGGRKAQAISRAVGG